MSKSEAPISNIGKKFLEELDYYLAENFRSLYCTDIYDLYIRFFRDLKEFKGNSNGFTGLSEFLIFRFIYHLLGGAFERKKVPGSELWEFVSKSNNELRLGQSIRVTINGRRYYPDIVVYHANRLIAVVQVKIYLTHGLKEVTKEIEILGKLREHHPEMRALLIIFLKLSGKGKTFPHLEKIKVEKPWFDFLSLEQSNELFAKTLKKCLGLDRLRAQFLSKESRNDEL